SPMSDEDEKMIEWAIRATGVYERGHMTIDNLSGGQQQRVGISMALAQDTAYVFIDEPTFNVDIHFQYKAAELVKQVNEEHNVTNVIVLHDINEAIQYSDTKKAMKQGKVIKRKKPKQIVTKELIHDVYGVHVVVKRDAELGMYIVPTGI